MQSLCAGQPDGPRQDDRRRSEARPGRALPNRRLAAHRQRFPPADVREWYHLPVAMEKDLVRLSDKGFWFWNQFFKQKMPLFQVEVTGHADLPGGWQLSGTMDVVHVAPDKKSAIILDWKTGRLEADHAQQMAGYAYLVWFLLGTPLTFTCKTATVYLRTLHWQTHHFTSEFLQNWRLDLVKNHLERQTFALGDHCRLCECHDSCPARSEATRSVLRDFDLENRDLNDPATLDGLMSRAKIAARAVEDAESFVRRHLQEKGPIILSDEKGWQMATQERNSIDPVKGWDLLSQLFTGEQLLGAMRLSFSQLAEHYCHQTPGPKGPAKEQFKNLLRRAGALKVSQASTLRKINPTTDI